MRGKFRADKAMEALEGYAPIGKADMETVVTNLLTDIMHLLDEMECEEDLLLDALHRAAEDHRREVEQERNPQITRLSIWKGSGTDIYLASPDEGVAIGVFTDGDALTDCRLYRLEWFPEECGEVVYPIGDVECAGVLATYEPAEDRWTVHATHGGVAYHIAQYLGLEER